MEIIKKEKPEPWHEKLKQMEVGEVMSVAFSDRSGVRFSISDYMKHNHPEMKFTTRTEQLKTREKYLEVKRLN